MDDLQPLEIEIHLLEEPSEISKCNNLREKSVTSKVSVWNPIPF